LSAGSDVTHLFEVRGRQQLSQSVKELLEQREQVLVVVWSVRHRVHLLEEHPPPPRSAPNTTEPDHVPDPLSLTPDPLAQTQEEQEEQEDSPRKSVV